MSTDNSLESRLARAAADLDSAAEQYEYRRSLAVAPSNAARTRVRLGLSFGVVGLAASLVLGVTLARNTAETRLPDTVPVAVDVPDQLTLSLPIGNDQRESIRFADGIATSSGGATYVIRRREPLSLPGSATGEGQKALLIDRTLDSPTRRASLLAVVDANERLVASQRDFGPEIQSIGVEKNGNLITFVPRFGTLIEVTTFQAVDSNLEPTGTPRRIRRYELSPDVSSAPELRFEPATMSTFLVVDRGQRRGWFMARKGQTLRIDQRSVPTRSRRAAQVKLQKNSTTPTPTLKMLLPDVFTTILPEDGRYEIVVEGGEPLTLELTIR